MDIAISVILAGAIMHGLVLVSFVAVAVLTAAIIWPIKVLWRWHKRRLWSDRV